MVDRKQTKYSASPRGFWQSRTGIILAGFLAVAGLLLVYEHRAHIFTGNWLLVVLLGACIVMHLFMHGGGHDEGDK